MVVFHENVPVRMCVGCRGRSPKPEMVRVVVRLVGVGHVWSLYLDLQQAAAGRGAYVHRNSRCLAEAQRRRAFQRALRVSESLDDTELTIYLTKNQSA
jgi:uncharacterized protein